MYEAHRHALAQSKVDWAHIWLPEEVPKGVQVVLTNVMPVLQDIWRDLYSNPPASTHMLPLEQITTTMCWQTSILNVWTDLLSPIRLGRDCMFLLHALFDELTGLTEDGAPSA